MSSVASSNGINVRGIREKLLRPALTSHYLCNFKIPGGSDSGFINSRLQINPLKTSDFVSLACFEASLPGSTLATHDINNDFTGVSEKHVYRRLYDDRADFSFYVDAREYYVIRLFEAWMGLAANEQYENIRDKNYFYRVSYPDTYITREGISITKFERSIPSPQLTYNFVNAFPISINSMQVSYDSSQLLKCTVSFAYTRYWISGTQVPNTPSTPPTTSVPNTEPRQSTPPGVPTPNAPLNPQQQANFNSQLLRNQSPNTLNQSANTQLNTPNPTREPRLWNSSYLGGDGTNGGTRQPRPWNSSNLRNPTPLF
jgi:hypothetical protein